jgi:hypothetical protein
MWATQDHFGSDLLPEWRLQEIVFVQREPTIAEIQCTHFDFSDFENKVSSFVQV